MLFKSKPFSTQEMYAANKGLAHLTPREREVLQCLLSGPYTNKEMGRELAISSRTVEVHRARICEKLGARSSMHAVRLLHGLEMLGDEVPRERPEDPRKNWLT
jgi:DNA-binding CsgD family transcriptional regulator